MNKIKIIKKNDEYSSEYQIGDTFKIEGTWYGGGSYYRKNRRTGFS